MGKTKRVRLDRNDDKHRLLGEYTSRGSARQETVWLGNLPVATVQNGSVYYIHADHLGTPRVITDNANMELWRWEADPFGTTAANEDADGDGHKLTYNLRFPGQYYDEETGRHYNYFRDYDPAVGRYVESDPLGFAGGYNTYTYALNSPLTHLDFLGLRSNCLECIIQCNMAFSWDEENRHDIFLVEWEKCRKHVPPKLTGCGVGVMSMDKYLARLNRRRFQNCLEGCEANECKDDDVCSPQ